MKIKSIQFISLIMLMVACSSPTQLTKTWTDPSVTPSTFKPFNKVLVMVTLKDQTGNRIAEDKIVSHFKRGNAVPSYSYLQLSDTVQKTVDVKLQKDGFAGLFTMRLTDVEESLDVYNSGYGGYYGYRYGGYSTVSVDKSYLVESSFYSLSTGKLLWSGTTSSFNPNSLDQMLDEIIVAVKNQLIKQGLIQP